MNSWLALLLQLEDNITAMMSPRHCLEGAFYCSVLSMGTTLYVHCMQTGCFMGGFEAAVHPRLHEMYPACNQVFWKVLNERDTKPADSSSSPPRKKDRKDKHEERLDKTYHRSVTSVVFKLFVALKDHLHLRLGCIIRYNCEV